jgi:hypothetical protein
MLPPVCRNWELISPHYTIRALSILDQQAGDQKFEQNFGKSKTSTPIAFNVKMSATNDVLKLLI